MTRPSNGTLVRLGFRNAEAALPALDRLGDAAGPLLDLLARTADPDQALDALDRLGEVIENPGALLEELVEDEGTAMRLLSVLGASSALADHLVRHPGHWRELTDPELGSTRPPAYALRADLLRAVGADPADPLPTATVPDGEALDALRVEYRRVLLRLAARDLAHHLGVDDTAAELSDLAAGTLEAALAVARQRVGADASKARLAVVAMGKCGGHELNYVSDVDVIFLHGPTDAATEAGTDEATVARVATRLASALIRVCSDSTGEGTIWPVFTKALTRADLNKCYKVGPDVRDKSWNNDCQ